MKHILLILSLLLSVHLAAYADFAQANATYNQGNYTEAALQYEQLIADAKAQMALTDDYAEVYYNLGNAYYKQGELAHSILAYERALRLQPRMKDAKENLRFVESKITDRIEDTHSFFLQDWLISFRNLFKEPTWMWWSIVLFCVMLAGGLLFLLSHESVVRKIAFHTPVPMPSLCTNAISTVQKLLSFRVWSMPNHRPTSREPTYSNCTKEPKCVSPTSWVIGTSYAWHNTKDGSKISS